MEQELYIKPRKYLLDMKYGVQKRMNESAICFKLFNKPGVMIDVGAHHGTSMFSFLKAGWTVYPFEPDPENRQMLAERFPNLYIDSRAVSNKPATNVTLYKSFQSTGISSLSPFHESHYAAIGVDVITLTFFIREQKIKKVDFLKIDTEGHDYFVLQGFPWKMKPGVILCEFENSKTEPLGYSFDDMAEFLLSKGYDLAISEWEPVVQYGGPHQWKQFLDYPCKLGEGAWGNIIATK